MKAFLALVLLGSTVACAVDPVSEEPPATESKTEEPPVEVEMDTTTPSYGSTFASNCYCTFCSRSCTVDGTTYKSGTCC